MMETNLEGVLTIKDSSNNLVAVVYNDTTNRVCRVFTVKECGIDDIQTLFKSFVVEAKS